MSYIGNEPTSVAFLTDTFSGNGSTTAFTLSAAPATTSSILVAITGVLQDPSTYSVSGTTLTFSPAPPTGTSNISVRFLGIPASGVTTTAYRTVTEFTATSGQTTFSVPSYTPGFIDVYQNGVMLGSADYTATSGLTVVLAIGATVGDLVEVISFQVSSVLNAMPTTGGTFSGNVLFASGGSVLGSNNRIGVGTNSPATPLEVVGTAEPLAVLRNSNANGYSSLRLYNNQNLSTRALEIDYSGSSYGGSLISGGPAGESACIVTTGAYPLSFGTSNTERGRFDASGNFLFNSGYGSVATAYGCRAWVNFNGTGTVAIRASGNVSSITDHSTGDYSVNFTTAMPDANYSAVTTAGNNNSNTAFAIGPFQPQTTSAYRLMTLNGSQGYADFVNVAVAIFR